MANIISYYFLRNLIIIEIFFSISSVHASNILENIDIEQEEFFSCEDEEFFSCEEDETSYSCSKFFSDEEENKWQVGDGYYDKKCFINEGKIYNENDTITLLPWHTGNRKRQVRIRTYISKSGKPKITLIAMCHLARPQFYQKVKQLCRNTIVVYELYNCRYDLSQIELIRERLKNDEIYLKRFDFMYDMSSCIFRSKHVDEIPFIIQPRIESGAVEIVHADQRSAIPYDLPQTEVALKKEIDKIALARFKKHNIINKDLYVATNSPDFLKDLLGMNDEEINKNLFKLHLQNQHDEILRTVFALDCLLNMPKSKPRKECSQIDKMVQKARALYKDKKNTGDREEIVYEKLRELWKRPNFNSDITVVYGAAHMPSISNFIMRNDYIPVDDGVLMEAYNMGSDSGKICDKITENFSNILSAY